MRVGDKVRFVPTALRCERDVTGTANAENEVTATVERIFLRHGWALLSYEYSGQRIYEGVNIRPKK